MKIRLLSDIHTEFKLPYKTHPMSEYRGEDVLVLAGDIASGSTNTVNVLKHFKSVGYKHVVYVPGNHEYYGTTFEDFEVKMRNKCANLEGIHFLNGHSVWIDDVVFIGATLWTNFGKSPLSEHAARSMITDFRLIKQFTPQDAIELYYQQRDYIKRMYELYNGKKKVIVTHFLPARQCIAPRYKEDPTGLNDYFANSLDDWIYDLSDTTWMYGHTHDAGDMCIGNTRVVANPYGYYTHNDGTGFDPYKTIEI